MWRYPELKLLNPCNYFLKKFRHAMQSLFVTVIYRVSQIANKLAVGETLTQDERIVLDMQREWDKLRT